MFSWGVIAVGPDVCASHGLTLCHTNTSIGSLKEPVERFL